mgnify:CR=1 FL=1
MNVSTQNIRSGWKPLLIIAGLLFLYSSVLAKLAYDWWTDDNYSHGLLVPVVIGYLVWLNLDGLKLARKKPEVLIGLGLLITSVLMLLVGTLAAELFTQRLSLVFIIVSVIVYFFGRDILRRLVVPFLLLLLAIPIPQIIFNKIALPLQIWASQLADWGIRLWGIPTVRNGNVIEIVPFGATDVVGLEVVEACSGIRSLMTLVTLALILGYFTRERREGIAQSWRQLSVNTDSVRIGLLILSAVPIALLTNAGRVMMTGMLTYSYGQETAEGLWHDLSGSVVFLTALALLILFNYGLKRLLCRSVDETRAGIHGLFESRQIPRISERNTVFLFAAILIGGAFVNWFQHRGEAQVERQLLIEIPAQLGVWQQRGGDFRFDEETEKILRASDYVMRDYFGPGKRLNLYVGYYASQRSGATYHSPQSCLPGSGWEMKDRKLIEIKMSGGQTFSANRYIVQRGNHREILIYWYQGRGRITPSEYQDKFYTSLDSILRRRSDGAMVRIMTPVGKDESVSLNAALDLSSQLADNISAFLPN